MYTQTKYYHSIDNKHRWAGLFIYILPEISPFPTTPPRIFPQ